MAKGKEGSGLKTRGLFKWLFIQRHGTRRPSIAEEDEGKTTSFILLHLIYCASQMCLLQIGGKTLHHQKDDHSLYGDGPFMAVVWD